MASHDPANPSSDNGLRDADADMADVPLVYQDTSSMAEIK